MFLGTHSPRLDDKGRLILPARFREDLAEGLVITKGQEHCLVVWPSASFEEYAGRLRTGSVTNERVRAYTRMLFASAFADAPDKQGRVTIPAALRDYAGLTRDCVVVGADTRVEIWDSVAWDAYEQDQNQGFADMDGEVVPMS